MLFAVRNFVLLLTFLLLSFANMVTPAPQAGPAGPPPQVPAAPPPSSSPPPAAAVQQTYAGPVIVIDPAHGGTDTGARGQGGVIEKDLVLQFARVTRGELVRQGYRVVLTRDDDSNPSYDDRAATANSYRDAIFVSLHISSTGAPGTSRAYYCQFWKPLPPASPAGASADGQPSAPVALSGSSPTGLVTWNEAQRSYVDQSQRLADQLQGQLAPVFPGSPQASAGVELRGLRSVATPAVDIEVSSVSLADARSLTVLAGPLAASIARGIQAFRPANSTGGK
jgi:N-acetylmuramoyl-L-alanine amidase